MINIDDEKRQFLLILDRNSYNKISNFISRCELFDIGCIGIYYINI